MTAGRKAAAEAEAGVPGRASSELRQRQRCRPTSFLLREARSVLASAVVRAW